MSSRRSSGREPIIFVQVCAREHQGIVRSLHTTLTGVFTVSLRTTRDCYKRHAKYSTAAKIRRETLTIIVEMKAPKGPVVNAAYRWGLELATFTIVRRFPRHLTRSVKLDADKRCTYSGAYGSIFPYFYTHFIRSVDVDWIVLQVVVDFVEVSTASGSQITRRLVSLKHCTVYLD